MQQDNHQWCIRFFAYGSRSHVRQKACISSGRPRDTRMYVSIGENRRPIRMFVLAEMLAKRGKQSPVIGYMAIAENRHGRP
jgi:hypothetical protein